MNATKMRELANKAIDKKRLKAATEVLLEACKRESSKGRLNLRVIGYQTGLTLYDFFEIDNSAFGQALEKAMCDLGFQIEIGFFTGNNRPYTILRW